MVRTKFSPWDLLAMGVVLVAALLLLLLPMLLRAEGQVLVVETPDGTERYELSVDRELTVRSNGITLTVVIKDGEARVAHSDCPDAICRSSGAKAVARRSTLFIGRGSRMLLWTRWQRQSSSARISWAVRFLCPALSGCARLWHRMMWSCGPQIRCVG